MSDTPLPKPGDKVLVEFEVSHAVGIHDDCIRMRNASGIEFWMPLDWIVRGTEPLSLPLNRQWSDWDAERCGMECQAGVGLTVINTGTRERLLWLCWDEVEELHGWLGQKIKEHQNGQ